MNTHKLVYQTRMSLNLKIMKFECSSTKLVICANELNTNTSRLDNRAIRSLIYSHCIQKIKVMSNDSEFSNPVARKSKITSKGSQFT